MPTKATPNRIAFNLTNLTAIQPPATGRLVVWDVKTPGLMLRVTPAGVKTFCLYKWTNGRPLKLSLGAFPGMTVEQARKLALSSLNDLASGKDPAAAKRIARGEATLAGLFDHWLEMHAKPHKKTWPEDQRQYDKFLTQWKARKLSELKRGDVQAWHSKLGREHGIYQANRALALLRAMFNTAVEIGWEGLNPCHKIKKFSETKRDRFLQPDELPKFFKALADEPNETLRDFFAICLFTGSRRSTVQAMRWEELNFDSRSWRIPDTKSGEPVVVPLDEPALAILERRQQGANGSPWVFASYGKKGYLAEPKMAWARLLKRGGLADLRMHDLRRTLGSYQAMQGASLTIIAKALGQKTTSATPVYARLHLDPVRESVNAAVTAIRQHGGLLSAPEPAKVSNHKGARRGKKA